MDKQEDILVYHPRYGRPLRGYLWVFVFIAVLFVVLVFSLVRVEVTAPLPRAQEGNLHYRSDDLLHLQVLMHSPMPLPLPAYVDPARYEEAAEQALPSRFTPGISKAPAERIFSAAHDSAVLDAAALIALPPVGLQDAPPAADGEEVVP